MILGQINIWVAEAFNKVKGALYIFSYIALLLLLWFKDEQIGGYFNARFNDVLHLNPKFDYFGFNIIYSMCNILILHFLYNLLKLKWTLPVIISINLILIGFQLYYYMVAK
jgi:hypothetical protein